MISTRRWSRAWEDGSSLVARAYYDRTERTTAGTGVRLSIYDVYVQYNRPLLELSPAVLQLLVPSVTLQLIVFSPPLQLLVLSVPQWLLMWGRRRQPVLAL